MSSQSVHGAVVSIASTGAPAGAAVAVVRAPPGRGSRSESITLVKIADREQQKQDDIEIAEIVRMLKADRSQIKLVRGVLVKNQKGRPVERAVLARGVRHFFQLPDYVIQTLLAMMFNDDVLFSQVSVVDRCSVMLLKLNIPKDYRLPRLMMPHDMLAVFVRERSAAEGRTVDVSSIVRNRSCDWETGPLASSTSSSPSFLKLRILVQH